jgi:hypothetical protein
MTEQLPPMGPFIDCSKRHIVAVGWEAGSAKLCQIQFHKDGFFVHFPYLPSEPGLISRCELGAGDTVLKVGESGGTVSHHAKYSHHGDGVALFSQDSKVRSVMRTTDAVRLLDSSSAPSHLFSIEAEGLEDFPPIEPSDWTRTSVGQGFVHTHADEPPLIHLAAWWTEVSEGVDITRIRNPVRLWPSTDSTEPRWGVAISPPADSPLYGWLMALDIRIRETSLQPGRDQYLFAFLGGFSGGAGDLEDEGSVLVLSYPCTDPGSAPSLDFERT